MDRPGNSATRAQNETSKPPAVTSGATIQISVDWITKHPDDFGLVIHELTHVIQNYPSQSETPRLARGGDCRLHPLLEIRTKKRRTVASTSRGRVTATATAQRPRSWPGSSGSTTNGSSDGSTSRSGTSGTPMKYSERQPARTWMPPGRNFLIARNRNRNSPAFTNLASRPETTRSDRNAIIGFSPNRGEIR